MAMQRSARLTPSEATRLDQQIAQVLNMKELSEAETKELPQRTKTILSEESNVAIVKCPVTVCGDLHGQFIDLKVYVHYSNWQYNYSAPAADIWRTSSVVF